MTLRSSIAMSVLTLTLFAACSSAPAETQDTSTDSIKETSDTMAVEDLGPISIHFGDVLAGSVDAEGRYLAGSDSSEPGKHVATFSADGTLTFVDTPEMKMVLAEDGALTMRNGDGPVETVPLVIGEDGSITTTSDEMPFEKMTFDSEGRLTSEAPLPENLANARVEGYSKVSPRHAAYAFAVTAMFTVFIVEAPAGPTGSDDGAPAPVDADVEEPAVAP